MIEIVALPGDGIGPEVMAEAIACLELLSADHDLDLRFTEHDFGGAAIDRHGDPLPPETLEACRSSAAVFMGAVGGDRWREAPVQPAAGLARLREELGLFANLRPAKVLGGLQHASPLRPDIAKDADVLLVRALRSAVDPEACGREEIERVAHAAFRSARHRRRKVTSVDRANMLAASRLWRSTVVKVAAQYADVELEHLYVDECAMALVTGPRRFDVILTENLFADILSDQLFLIAGSVGLLGSASLGDGGPGLFGPTQGAAHPIAGLNVANPAGAIASAIMMLDELGLGDSGRLLSDALDTTLREGCRTADLGGTSTCSEFGARVRQNLQRSLGRFSAFRQLIAMNRGCCG